MGPTTAGPLPPALRHHRRRFVARWGAVDQVAFALLVPGAGVGHGLPGQVPRRLAPALRSRRTGVTRKSQRGGGMGESRVLLRVALETATQAVGGLQQAAVCGTRKTTHVPRPLHPPGGPKQPSTDLVQRRRSPFPLPRPDRRRPTQNCRSVRRRILAALFASRVAERILAYPPLWLVGQPTKGRVARTLPHPSWPRTANAENHEDDSRMDHAIDRHRRDALPALRQYKAGTHRDAANTSDVHQPKTCLDRYLMNCPPRPASSQQKPRRRQIASVVRARVEKCRIRPSRRRKSDPERTAIGTEKAQRHYC